jgi:integrase
MQWQEIEGDVWIIRGDAHKTGDEAGDMAIPLTPSMRALMGERQKRGFVFSTTDGAEAFSGFSKAKRALDKAIAELRKADGREPMPAWTLHDLRRTGRSLMSRAGVPSRHAELALGHTLQGVERVMTGTSTPPSAETRWRSWADSSSASWPVRSRGT